MDICSIIIRIAKDVFASIGPGHSEALYCRAIGVGLQKEGITYEYEKTVPVNYMDVQVGTCRLDIVVDGFVLEMKSVNILTPLHTTQLKRYLNILNLQRGMLVNFGPTGVDVMLVYGNVDRNIGVLIKE